MYPHLLLLSCPSLLLVPSISGFWAKNETDIQRLLLAAFDISDQVFLTLVFTINISFQLTNHSSFALSINGWLIFVILSSLSSCHYGCFFSLHIVIRSLRKLRAVSANEVGHCAFLCILRKLLELRCIPRGTLRNDDTWRIEQMSLVRRLWFVQCSAGLGRSLLHCLDAL